MSKRQTPSELSELLAYAELGLHIIPAYVDENGKKRPGLPGKRNWQDLATTNAEQIKMWYHTLSGKKNTLWGFLPARSGITVVDIDIKNGKQGDVTLKRLMGGRIPKTSVVRTASGGMHYYFKSDTLVRGGKAELLGSGVDILGHGRFAVIPPSKINGKRYAWTSPLKSISSLPTLPVELTPKVEEHVVSVKSIPIEESKANALTAMKNILPSRAVEYDDWVRVLMCLHSVDSTDAQIIKAALKFSKYSAKFSERDFYDKWNYAFKTDGSMLTPGTLVNMAQQDAPILEQLSDQAELYLPLLGLDRFTLETIPELAKRLVVLGDRGRELFIRETTSRTTYTKAQCIQIFDSQQLSVVDNTIDELREWAEKDSPAASQRAFVTIGRKVKPLTKHYEAVLEYLGKSVQLNEMNGRVYIDGRMMDKYSFAQLYSSLREFNLFDVGLAEIELDTIASKHKFHPLRDRLNELMWDGEPHIANFAARYVKNADGFFPLLLRKALIGAVRRIMKDEYSPMLVLESSTQGVGKSYFVEWLSRVFPTQYFCTINPREIDKNQEITKLCDYAIAEMPEIDALPKDSQEHIKSVLSNKRVQLRRAYDRYDTDKPVVATVIGTFNLVYGLLSDPSGDRRFRVCSVEGFDYQRYTKEVDPVQLWAEAMYAVQTVNETADLDPGTEAELREYMRKYAVISITDDSILECFDVTLDPADTMTTLEIINTIEMSGARVQGSLSKRELTRSLKIARVEPLKRTTLTDPNGNRWGGYVWSGIRPKVSQPFNSVAAAETLFKAKVKEK